MRAPDFWYDRKPGVVACALAPFGRMYGAGTARRLARGRPVDPGVPVVCVGNLTAGGSGKTPVVQDVSRRLAALGAAPHVISRGYGGKVSGPHRVDPDADTMAQVGDEPLMLAAGVPVWVGGDRPAMAAAAVGAGAGSLVMDDGFQDPSLGKSLSLLVGDGHYGFGNGLMIPAGPLREPPAAGLARADALVVVGKDAWGLAQAARDHGHGDLPVLACRPQPGSEIDALKAGGPLYAFAGIAHPRKFFRTLEEGGCELAGRVAFSDHYPYSDADLEELRRKAAAADARLVTTEKDYARLAPSARHGIEVLTITLHWDDEAALGRLLAGIRS